VAAADHEGIHGAAGSKRLVLVAEDDPDILDLVCVRLDQAGYATIRAFDGERAVRLARDRLPSACILDPALAVLGGLEVLRELRRGGPTARIPVILLSTATAERDIERGLEAGADDYVIKPFAAPELLRRLAAVMEGSRGRAGSGESEQEMISA
jgi:DNA-binding response OmpR family regulator